MKPQHTEDLLIKVLIDQSVLTERISQLEAQLAGVNAKSIKAQTTQVKKTLKTLTARAQA